MNIQKMIVTTALVVTAAAAAGSALADARYPVDAPFVSTKTRAEVRAELTVADANHELDGVPYIVKIGQQLHPLQLRQPPAAELAVADANHELDGVPYIVKIAQQLHPLPTAAAARLTDPLRTSPTANTPG